MENNKQNGKVIETAGLTKLFGSLKAVDEVSLNVEKGEIYGFLGLNGAGKTTTIRMLLGMIRPASGEARLFGKKIIPGHPGPWEKVGYLVEMPYSYPELTVRENLSAVSRLRGLKGNNSLEKIIQLLHLTPYMKVKARNLSQGNNQRLGLAKALIHRPEILILDEPSNGLDPSGIVEVRELLKDYALNHGVTVFISSHNLAEIAKLATRIGIIHHGRLVQEIDAEKLDAELEKSLFIGIRDRKGAVEFLTGKGFAVNAANNGSIQISDPAACEEPEKINTLLVQNGFPPHHLNVVQEDLESYFLRTIGEKHA
ncbi:MAG: ABC transporter ATP-binding protein [Spirochaetales bacterium]|nr:ABC transporter ATP-binding protein [Spirochaetales bacterium]